MPFGLPKNINDFHHAYILEGNAVAGVSLCEYVRDCLRASGYAVPDVELLRYAYFTVEDARTFRAREHRANVYPKVRILMWGSYGAEALQALLKLIEEPSPNTYYMFVVSHMNGLPETFISRSIILRPEKQNEFEDVAKEAEHFLADTPTLRLAYVRKLLESFEQSAEESAEKRQAAIIFVKQLEQKVKERKNVVERGRFWEVLREAKHALGQQSLPPRLALEHLAIALP